MIRESEPLQPSQGSVGSIRLAASQCAPDSPELVQWYQAYSANHQHRLALDLHLIGDHLPKDTRLLEVGCIPPILTAALKQAGWDVRGVDIAPERFSQCIKALDLRVLKCDIERDPLPMGDDSVDAVLFNEIFEHLRINPIFTLSEVHRVLRPGGALLLSTPNLRSLGGIRNFLIHERAFSCCSDLYTEYDKLAKLGHMGHVREYTVLEVSDFLTKLGFTPEKVVFRGSYKGLTSRTAIRLAPSLRPFFSLVARKAP